MATSSFKVTKADAKAITFAREVRIANPGYYAATLAGIQRCGSRATQQAIEAIIATDGTSYMFRRVNGCLLPVAA